MPIPYTELLASHASEESESSTDKRKDYSSGSPFTPHPLLQLRILLMKLHNHFYATCGMVNLQLGQNPLNLNTISKGFQVKHMGSKCVCTPRGRLFYVGFYYKVF